MPTASHRPAASGSEPGRPAFLVHAETLDRLPTPVHRMVADALIAGGEWQLVENASAPGAAEC